MIKKTNTTRVSLATQINIFEWEMYEEPRNDQSLQLSRNHTVWSSVSQNSESSTRATSVKKNDTQHKQMQNNQLFAHGRQSNW